MSAEAPSYVVADVAVDEDFVNQVGDEWELQVHRMLEGGNALLAQVGLRIEVGSTQRWLSGDDWDDVPAHVIFAQLISAEQQIQRVPGRLLLAITGQYTPTYDGFALESGSKVIVRFYQGDQRRNSALIAHEVGHLLGARHHEDEAECTEYGCILDESGFSHATAWCQHHKQVIRESIASKIVAQGRTAER